MYGSDYLLGLSTFAPAEFAARDRCWADGDVDGFHRRNDVLQWLGTTAFRPPVPAYRHDAALFFQLRGWAESDATPEGAPRRAAWERDLLAEHPRRARGGRLVVRRRDFPQVKNLKTRRRLPRPPRRRSASRSRSTTRPTSTRSAAPIEVAGRRCANRFAILPMEGWDGTDDGRPTDLVRRRWQRFGTSGAGLVWGGEAFAVRPDGRANPHQLCLGPSSADDLAELRGLLDPTQVTGLQLTHSGRWSVEPRPARARSAARRTARRSRAHRRRARRPRRRLRRRRPPRARPPASTSSTSRRATATSSTSCSPDDGELAERADHDAHDHRAGPRRGHPGRRAAVDLRPAAPPPRARRRRRAGGRRSRGASTTPLALDRPARHRPALRHRRQPLLLPARAAAGVDFPPSDGYAPPEDPLVGVARLLDARRRASPPPARTSRSSPPGFSYLQEWLPHVASAVVARRRRRARRHRPHGPQLPRPPRRRARRPRRSTGGACAAPSATAPPRRATASCPAAIPLDPMYKEHPDRPLLVQAKKRARALSRSGRRRRRARHRADARVVVAADEGPLRRRRRAPTPTRPAPTDAAERTGAAIVTFDEAIARDDVDIVDLCTPPSLHLEQITAALAAGKHVVCEKPLVASLRDCRRARRGRGGQRRTAHADLPVPVRQRPPEGEGPRRPRRRRPGLHVVGRGRVAAAGRLLRGAVARAVGDRARWRAAQPGRPRPRHAHLHRRPADARCSPGSPPA